MGAGGVSSSGDGFHASCMLCTQRLQDFDKRVHDFPQWVSTTEHRSKAHTTAVTAPPSLRVAQHPLH